MNLPNKSTIGGMLAFHEGNHNENGNPHPQYTLNELYVIPINKDSNTKWAKVLETYATKNTTTNFIYAIQSGGNADSYKLNAIIYIDFTITISGKVSVNIDIDNEGVFPIGNIGYKVEDDKIKLYMKNNYTGNSLILKRLSSKIESGTTYLDDIVYEDLNDVIVCKSKKIGLTVDRPAGVQQGFQYYDRNLGRPIWWNGTVWTDATGSRV